MAHRNLVQSVPEAEVVAIADPFLNEDAVAFAQGLGITKYSKDPQDIFENPEIEAVFVCTSTDAHAEMIQRTAAAGKHVFCEKPVHTDLNEIHKAIGAVEDAGVKLQVGFVRRFDHNHKKVHDVVASGKLGQPHIVKVCSRDPGHQPMEYIATSGGIFMDMPFMILIWSDTCHAPR